MATRRAGVVLLISVAALWSGTSAASGAFAPDRVAAAAQSPTSAPAPAPTYKPVWTKRPLGVRAGSRARLTLDPVSATRCRVSLTGPRRGQSLAFNVSGGGRLAHLTIRTRRNATPGRWRLRAACRQRSGPVLSAGVPLAVEASRTGGRKGMLAGLADITLRRASSLRGRNRAAGRIQGKGAAGNRFEPEQCTFWADETRSDIYLQAVDAGVKPSGKRANAKYWDDYVWNGKYWAENARAARIPTGKQPAVGALYVDTTGRYGHVAYVEEVYADGRYRISERNATGSGKSKETTYSTKLPGRPGIEFVYGGQAAGAEYIGHIVHWDGDTKAQKTAWYVINDRGRPRRNWIPDIPTYACLKRRGAPGPTVLSGAVLSGQLPDQVGVHATCADGVGGDPPPPAPPAPGAPPPPPPAQPTPPTTVTLTVYNKVTNGATEMREDTPAYLSTVPRNFCKRDGCAIAGTDRNTGGTYSPAVCQTQGVRTTNGNDGNSNDDGNPGLFSSTRWYGVRLGNGALGYISEVWIHPSQRGGAGLVGC